MQEMHDSSIRKRLTVEQLLQLKRLEKPVPPFWESFERELQQKQLQALVKPSRLQRIRTLLLPRSAILAPLAAAAGFAAVALLFMPFRAEDRPSAELASHEVHLANGDETEGADGDAALVDAGDVQSPRPRRTDAQFVVDALVPDHGPLKPFRTVAVPETFVAASDGSSYYVVNAFTAGTGPADLGVPDAVLEF